MNPALVHHMAAPAMRLSHLLWHALRDHWERTPHNVREQYAARFGKDWIPPRRSIDENGQPIVGFGAGKDFLYMHRLMISRAEHITKTASEPDIVRWTRLPKTVEPGFPVCHDSRLMYYSAKRHAVWVKEVQVAKRLVHPDSMAKLSIDELGSMIEIRIHVVLHQRFGAYATLGRLRRNATEPLRPGSPWAQPEYDTLLDAYSAHVHPWFWGIHTWIDAQIGAWEQVHNRTVDWTDCWLGGWHDMDEQGAAVLSGHPVPGKTETLAMALATLAPPASCGMYRTSLSIREFEDLLDTLLSR